MSPCSIRPPDLRSVTVTWAAFGAISLLAVPPAASAAIVAYDVPAGLVGAFGGTQYYALGMEFDVVEPVYVTALGAFDSGSDGNFGDGTVPVRVAIFDRASQQPVTPIFSFSTADPGTALDGSRFKDLLAPVLLPAGFQGVIVADGYNGSRAERNGNISNQTQTWSFEGGPQLSGTTVARNLANGTLGPAAQLPFPTITVNTATTAAFAAGTFQFTPVPEPSTGALWVGASLMATVGLRRTLGSGARSPVSRRP